MAKIIIPGRKIVSEGLEIELVEDELILLVNAGMFRNGEIISVYFGVFKGMEEFNGARTYPDKIRIKPQFTMKKSERFGGDYARILENSKYGGRYDVSAFIRQIYSGQEQIVQALKSWPGFEGHAEWVSKLRKPYLE